MTSTTRQDALKDVLAQLELVLGTPVVPGELRTWLDGVRGAFAAVQRQLREVLESDHPAVLDQIEQRSPSFEPRVQQMRSRDGELLTQLQELAATLESLQVHAEQSDWDEDRLGEHIDRARDMGLRLVIEARRQETELATWYLEAFQRERGGGD